MSVDSLSTQGWIDTVDPLSTKGKLGGEILTPFVERGKVCLELPLIKSVELVLPIVKTVSLTISLVKKITLSMKLVKRCSG